MGALSDDDANNLLEAKFRGGSLDVPASYWVALSTTQPNDDGSNVTEPTGTGYGRAEAPADSATWAAPDSRTITNAVDLVFSDPDPGDDWGVLGWAALYDDPTAGTFRGWGAFGEALHIDDTQNGPVIPAGVLVIFAPGTP